MLVEGGATARYHAEHYGDLPYDGFVERFRDEMIPDWDPQPLADLIAAAGARYAVLFAMTEDGFLMWPSDVPNPHKAGWQSERDVVGELGDGAARAGRRATDSPTPAAMDWTFADCRCATARDVGPAPQSPSTSPTPMRTGAS